MLANVSATPAVCILTVVIAVFSSEVIRRYPIDIIAGLAAVLYVGFLLMWRSAIAACLAYLLLHHHPVPGMLFWAALALIYSLAKFGKDYENEKSGSAKA
jgi:biotin transporter BioY